MHLKKCSCLAALTMGLLVSSSTTLHAQGFGGNVNGSTGIALPAVDLYKPVSAGRTYTDLELTSITRAEEDTANQAVLDSIGKLSKAANDARLALVAASLAMPANAANTEAKAKVLGDAELALANGRATTLAALVRKVLPAGSDAAKVRAIATSMETRATARVTAAARGGQ